MAMTKHRLAQRPLRAGPHGGPYQLRAGPHGGPYEVIPGLTPRARCRRGVSLLEVLISIFVLSVGLLGVAALIPVGAFTLSETAKADRSAACGRAALREIKVRRMLDPVMWVGANGDRAPMVGGNINTSDGQPFAIDPLFVARYPAVTTFPYGNATITVPRITLASQVRPWSVATPGALSPAAAERIFTWQDDLLFDIPKDTSLRPLQLYLQQNGSFGPVPINAVLREIEGQYSWMVTVSPALSERGLLYTDSQQYNVSAAVFYKRDFSSNPSDPKPSERTVTVDFLGGGLWGGGDVELIGPGSSDAAHNVADYLDLKQDEWLLLCGQMLVQNPSPPNTRVNVVKWYRVVAAGEAVDQSGTGAGPWTRHVTLAGPDWDNSIICLRDNNGKPIQVDSNNIAQAVLIDGVVGVYSSAVQLDRDPLWTK